MSMVYTEEQQLLRESARTFLQQKANPAVFRAVRDNNIPGKVDPQTWPQMVELGWSGIVVSEAYGGLDFGYSGAGVLLEEMGRSLARSPFLETAVIGATAIALAGNHEQKTKFLPAICDGETTCAFAIDEGPRHNPAGIAMSAARDGDHFVLHGTKTFVRNGESCNLLLVAARTAGRAGEEQGISLFLLESDTEGVAIQEMEMTDHCNTAIIHFNKVRIPVAGLLGDEGDAMPVISRVLDVANICLAAEMLGIAREAFERTVAYLKERRQFGVALSSFQALQHRAAHMHCELEVAVSVVMKALQVLDTEGASASVAASLAKARLCKTVRLVTNEAIQMHGGIGMTDEFDIGFYVKKGRVSAGLFGDYHYHAMRFAALKGY